MNVTMRPTVLVTQPAPPEAIGRLRACLEVRLNDSGHPWSSAELVRQASGCAGLMVVGGDRIDAAVLDALPGLKVVANMAVGYNNIDVEACTARGVLVTNTPDVLTETTADFGFALMMAAARRMSEGERFLRSGQWSQWRYDLLAGPDVHGATLGILGMGRIGQAIARRGALGFGMPVIYHNRTRLDADREAACQARWVEKDALLREADHLIVVLPYSAATHHAVGAPELALMKPSATLTNIARGGVVDEDALVEALCTGRLAAAGLDVFEGEPSVRPALLNLPNVVLTPHIASASVPTRRAMGLLAADNLLAALGQGPTPGRPPTPVNAVPA